jgi:hypothetical protein
VEPGRRWPGRPPAGHFRVGEKSGEFSARHGCDTEATERNKQEPDMKKTRNMIKWNREDETQTAGRRVNFA